MNKKRLHSSTVGRELSGWTHSGTTRGSIAEHDDEMIDLSSDGNRFVVNPFEYREELAVDGNVGDMSDYAKQSAVSATFIQPMKALPPGLGRYDDFETIDWVKDIARDRHRHRRLHKEKKTSVKAWACAFWDSMSGWLCVLLVGILAGLIALTIDIGSTWMSDLKEGVCRGAFWLNREQCCWVRNDSDVERSCQEWYSWSRLMLEQDPIPEHPVAYLIGYLFYVVWALFFSGLCVVLVKMFAPYACGSGIPEIKTILSGFVIRGYLGAWTLIIKSLGMILAVSAGLSLGKEGPMVHMASCCGNIMARLFPKYGKNEAKKREILSASAAAGVAVAFNAPIGGVLFSLEEASYYFPLKTLFRSFFCALVSANLLRLSNPFGSETPVLFFIKYTNTWHGPELVPFAMLGVLGGVFGAVFIRANLFICWLRKTTWLGRFPIREVLLITLITALASFPHEYLRMSTSEMIRILFTQCRQTENITLCDYVRNVSDPNQNIADTNLPAGDGVKTAMWLLSVALIFKLLITIFTFGIKVPTGLFIPSMAVGALVGRMLGVGVEQLVVAYREHPLVVKMCKSTNGPCINPGVYAMVGAASCLGGVTRMTISLVVIMLELTNGLDYIIPLMVAAMVAKWTGDRLSKGSIYDGHIRLNGYPYLSSSDAFVHTTLASDVMVPRRGEPPLHLLTETSMTVGDLEMLLASSTVKGFPVIVSKQSPHLVGWVTRRDLLWALDSSRRDPDMGIVTNSRIYFTEHPPQVPHLQPQFAGMAATFRPGNTPNPLHLRHLVDLSPITITDQTAMETVLDGFRKLGLRQVLITRNGQLLGIITKKDVLRHILQLDHQDPASLLFS